MDHTAEAAAGRALEPDRRTATPGTSQGPSVSRGPSVTPHPDGASRAEPSGSSSGGSLSGLLSGSSPSGSSRSHLEAARDAAGAALGTVMGIIPHVLHHIGLLAGAALVTGTTGNVVFLVVGLLFSVPLLRRIHRRFRTWVAPVVAVGVFAALFSVSAFVIGPALSGTSRLSVTSNTPSAPAPSRPSAPEGPAGPAVDGHAGHHP